MRNVHRSPSVRRVKQSTLVHRNDLVPRAPPRYRLRVVRALQGDTTLEAIPYLALVSAIAALALAFFFYNNVKAASPGNERMQFLMHEIQKGARAFLKQEYTWVAGFVAIMAIIIAILIDPVGLAALTYVFGAFLSAAAGYIGMTVATMANARTTEAAREGPGKALPLAFRGGAVMGFTVAGLALGGLSIVYIVFVQLAGSTMPSTCSPRSAWARARSHCSAALAAVSTPRQPTSVPTSSARSKPASPRTTPGTRPPSPTTWATTWATSPAWAQTCSRAMAAPSSLR